MSEFPPEYQPDKKNDANQKKEAISESRALRLLGQLKRLMTEGVGHRLRTTEQLGTAINATLQKIERQLLADQDSTTKLPISAHWTHGSQPTETTSAYWSASDNSFHLRTKLNQPLATDPDTKPKAEIVEFHLEKQADGAKLTSADVKSRSNVSNRIGIDAQKIENQWYYPVRLNLRNADSARRLLSVLKQVQRELKATGASESDTLKYFSQINESLHELAQHDPTIDGQGASLADAIKRIADAGGNINGYKNFDRKALTALLELFKGQEKSVKLFGARVPFTQDLVGDYGLFVFNSFDHQDVEENAIFPTQALNADNWYRMAVEYYSDNPQQPKKAYLETTEGGHTRYSFQIVAEFDPEGNITAVYQPGWRGTVRTNYLESHDSQKVSEQFINWLTAIAHNPNEPSREAVFPDKDFGYDVKDNLAAVTLSGIQMLEEYLETKPRHAPKIQKVLAILGSRPGQVGIVGQDGEIILNEASADQVPMSLDELIGEKKKN